MNPAPYYRILDPRGEYELVPRPRTPARGTWDLIWQSQGEYPPQGGPWSFNWVARRDPVFLVSGDLPRFALARTFRIASTNPPLWKLTDVRIRVKVGDQAAWLDEIDGARARYFPWGTVHECEALGVRIEATASLAGNRGIAVRLDCRAAGKETDAVVEAHCGAIEKSEITIAVPYLEPDPKRSADCEVCLDAGTGVMRSPGCDVEAAVRCDPAGDASVVDTTIVFRNAWRLGPEARTLRVLAWQREKDSAPAPELGRFESEVSETKAYYRELLAPYAIETPEPEIDAAFYAGIVNLDYQHHPPGWLEGLHKWNTYFTNNYQISAAIGLGWEQRAREALVFFAGGEGPAPIRTADGANCGEVAQHGMEDGIPYFVLQLHRYWKATGDDATLRQVWEPTAREFARMLKVRDPDGNGLLNWHLGCNAFLYQADHLSLPGKASSPSLMGAHLLRLMAEMASATGDAAQVKRWAEQAEAMKEKTLRTLWSEPDGKFVAAIDPQGLTMKANYYTDFVFPQLYSTLDERYAWTSLATLDRTLWVGDLMRVGNYKPKLFGNDNVMPVQMAEAAEAYFRAGRTERGVTLLRGVARAATICTDSPGSFPERMNDEGWGFLDFCFGNPTASYLRGVIAGLFGIERSAPGREFSWQPAIPEDWKQASLRLPGIAARIDGAHGDRTFSLDFAEARPVRLSVPLHGSGGVRASDDSGVPLAVSVRKHPSGDFLEIALPVAKNHRIRVVCGAAAWKEPWVRPPKPAPAVRIALDGRREAIALDGALNADAIESHNFWSHAPVPIDMAKVAPDGVYAVGEYRFRVKTSGLNTSVVSLGDHEAYSLEFKPSRYPNRLGVEIGKMVNGLEMLMVAEMKTRCTGMKIGSIRLIYADGEQEVPLVYGENADCRIKPFARDVVSRDSGGCWTHAISITADPARMLRRVEWELIAADGMLGVFGINAILPE